MSTIATAVLIDFDHLSYGPADHRQPNQFVHAAIDAIDAAVSKAGCDVFFDLAACSTETATQHFDLLSERNGNRWRACTGLDGADHELVCQLHFVRERARARRVVLVGGDHIYAPALRALRVRGISPWLIGWGGSVSRALVKQADVFLDLRSLVAAESFPAA